MRHPGNDLSVIDEMLIFSPDTVRDLAIDGYFYAHFLLELADDRLLGGFTRINAAPGYTIVFNPFTRYLAVPFTEEEQYLAVDKIVTLRDGQVDEVGSPAELAKTEGIYSQLLTLQMGNTEKAKKARDYIMTLPGRLAKLAERISPRSSEYRFNWIIP